jgi:hypothetical protein
MTSITSRRALLTAAAAVPASALLPAASTAIAAAAPNAESAEQSDPVIELAERVILADGAHGEACKAFNPFDTAFGEWKEKNPPPKIRAVRIGDTDDPTSVYAKKLGKWLLNETAQADYIAAKEEHLAAMKRWERRLRAARKRTGYDRAYAAQGAACHACADLVDELSKTLPRTFAGLVAKARAARVVAESGLEIGEQVTWDIGVMAGEITPREAADSLAKRNA